MNTSTWQLSAQSTLLPFPDQASPTPASGTRTDSVASGSVGLPEEFHSRFIGRDFDLAVVDRNHPHVRLQAAGELDLVAAVPLARLLAQLVDAGYRFVNVDLSAATFLDCTCLGTLLAAHRRCRTGRGDLILSGVGARLVRLLELAELTGTLAIAPGPPRD